MLCTGRIVAIGKILRVIPVESGKPLFIKDGGLATLLRALK